MTPQGLMLSREVNRLRVETGLLRDELKTARRAAFEEAAQKCGAIWENPEVHEWDEYKEGVYDCHLAMLELTEKENGI